MIRDLRWTFLAEMVSRVVSLVTVPLLTRAFVPEEYGLYKSLLLVVVYVFFVYGSFNLGPLLMKRLPELDEADRAELLTASTALVVSLTLGGVVVFILLLQTSALSYISTDIQAFARQHSPLIVALFASRVLWRYAQTVCKALDRFGTYSVAMIAREVLFLLFILVIFFESSLTIVRVITGLIGVNVLAIAISFGACRHPLLTTPDFGHLWSQFRTISVPLIPRSVIKKVNTTILDSLVVAAFGTAAFGIWSVVFVFAPIFLFISSGFSRVLLPKISKRLSSGTPIDNILATYYRFTAMLIAPGIVGGWLVGVDIIRVGFGAEYATLPLVATILITTFGVRAALAPAGPVFIATDQSRYTTYLQLIKAVPNLSFVLVGGYVLDSMAVAATGLLAANLLALAFALYYQREVSDITRPATSAVGKLGMALVVMGFTVLYTRTYISGILTMLLVVGAGAIVYFAVLFLSGFFSDRDYEYMRRFVGI